MEEYYKDNGVRMPDVPELPPAPPDLMRRRMKAPTVPSTVEAEPVEHVKRGKSQASRTTDHSTRTMSKSRLQKKQRKADSKAARQAKLNEALI